MATLDWELDRTDGVTLVRLYVTADHPRRVRVENRLDGPVWPPRRQGEPAAGWADDAFEGRVTPDDRLVMGYATPAPPDDDPPAAIVRDEPAAATTTAVTASDRLAGVDDHRVPAADGGGGALESDAESPDGVEQTPAGVVRELGDPTVPRDAVPVPDVHDGTNAKTNGSPPAEGPDDSGGDGNAPSHDASRGVGNGSADCDPVGGDAAGGDGDGHAGGRPVDRGAGRQRASLSTDHAPVVPHPVRAWLRDVERRLDAVERRGVATVEPDETLGVAVTADGRALARVARRVETLAERAERLQVERRRHGERPRDDADGGR